MKFRIFHFVLLGTGVLVLDILTDFGLYDWLLYWLLAGYVSTQCDRKKTYLVSSLYSFYILAGLIISQKFLLDIVLNHAVGVAVIWIIVYNLTSLKEAHSREKNVWNQMTEVYNRIDEIVFGLDNNWRLIYKNIAADRYGYTFIKIGDNFWEKLPNAIGTELEINFRKAMSAQEPVTFLYKTQYSNTPRSLYFTAYPSENGLSVYTKDVTEIIKAERGLAEAHELLRMVTERITDIFWAVDQNWNLVYANDKFAEQTGISLEKIVGRNLYEILPAIQNTLLEEKLNEALKSQQNVKFEMKSIYSKGRYVSFSVHPSSNGLTVVAHDNTDYQDTQIKLKEALREKEFLLSEVFHRVKNNLQLIISIINLKSNKISDTNTKSLIAEISQRLQSIMLLHSKLHNTKSLGSINLSEYIREIVQFLERSYDNHMINITLSAEKIEIDSYRAMLVGIIVNELISNSYKYAFPEGQEGEIAIRIIHTNMSVELLIEDSGAGYPDKNLYSSDSLGMELVSYLAEELNGYLQVQNRNGAFNKIVFPLQSVGKQ